MCTNVKKNNPWYLLSLHLKWQKMDQLLRYRIKTIFHWSRHSSLHQETVQNIYFFEVGVFLPLLLAVFLCEPRLKPFQTVCRVEAGTDILSLCLVTASSLWMCWCLPYALISFPLGQMADTGFQHYFPNTLFVLNCNLFNFPVGRPSNELY